MHVYQNIRAVRGINVRYPDAFETTATENVTSGDRHIGRLLFDFLSTALFFEKAHICASKLLFLQYS